MGWLVMVAFTEEIVKNKNFSIYRHIPKNIHDLANNLVVVTFDNIAGGLKSRGFGTNFLIKNGIKNFFVSHKSGSFFQDLSESDLSKYIGHYLVGKRVVSYGASLGGYAALYYSSVLNGRPLAFSPRCSADPIYLESQELVEFINITS